MTSIEKPYHWKPQWHPRTTHGDPKEAIAGTLAPSTCSGIPPFAGEMEAARSDDLITPRGPTSVGQKQVHVDESACALNTDATVRTRAPMTF